MSLSFITIGGDTTSFGKADGFKRFINEIVPRLQPLVEDTKAICIVPGNHDVTWGLDATKRDYFKIKFDLFRQMVERTGFSTCLLPNGELKRGNHVQTLRFIRPLNGPIYIDSEKRVIVLNINSAVRCGELNLGLYDDIKNWAKSPNDQQKSGDPLSEKPKSKDDISEEFQNLRKHLIRDIAQVTQSQINMLEAELQKYKDDFGNDWSTYLRVALVHHPLAHYPGQQAEHKGYEFMVDSSAVLKLLSRFDFDIALTGHKHCPYEMKYRFGEKEIFIVGGPTVGGLSADNSYRGFRLITFESDQFRRKLSVNNIQHGLGVQAAANDLYIDVPEADIIAQGVAVHGYSYRDVVSITKINDDGDAHRIVECDHLVVARDVPRRSRHDIELPSTSGYLDNFHVAGDSPETGVKLDQHISLPRRASSGSLRIEFRPELSLEQPVSYHYEWNAVNSFALDKLQFDRKYGPDVDQLRYQEFTHFNPTDPIDRLTVIVQFPREFVLSDQPTLRIARVDRKEDSRKWKLDSSATRALNQRRALRYFKSLNIVALRVKAPNTELSYGIEWKLPDAPPRRGGEQLARVIRHFESTKDLKLLIYHILKASRKTLLPAWERELDANLMVFGMAKAPSTLVTVSAALSEHSVAAISTENESIQELSSQIDPLPYGLGIAGRAFKANRIRIYVAQDDTQDRRSGKMEPDFYIPLANSPKHKRLICFPLHIPVSDETFRRDSNVYLDREPYGVINIGSESDDCPISELLLATNNDAFKSFQHEVNWMAVSSFVKRI